MDKYLFRKERNYPAIFEIEKKKKLKSKNLSKIAAYIR